MQAEENEDSRKSEDRRAWRVEAAVTSLLASLYLMQMWPCKPHTLKNTLKIAKILDIGDSELTEIFSCG